MERGPTILQVMDHPGLLGPHFDSPSWAAWRVSLKSLFGLPMDNGERVIFQEHTGRQTAPTTAFKEAQLVVGRRAGKSRILATVATYLAVCRDYSEHLAAGETATIAIISADRSQCRTIFRYILGLLESVPAFAAQIEDYTKETITLRNRVVVEIHTASFRVTRGYTYAVVLCDEVAFWRDENSAVPDVEIYKALRPGLSTIPGAMLLTASSPYRKSGVLYTTYKRHCGRDDARVLAWQASTSAMNPGVDPQVIEEAYADDPASAAAEFGGQFRDDISDFITPEIVAGCVETGCYERAPATKAGRRYCCFVDAAGGTGKDSFTLGISHPEDGIPVLDVIRERKPPFSPDDAVEEYAA